MCIEAFCIHSGGSRISRRGGGVDLQYGHFSVKMYAKTKELGPIGGRAPGTPPPPRSANDSSAVKHELADRCQAGIRTQGPMNE